MLLESVHIRASSFVTKYASWKELNNIEETRSNETAMPPRKCVYNWTDRRQCVEYCNCNERKALRFLCWRLPLVAHRPNQSVYPLCLRLTFLWGKWTCWMSWSQEWGIRY
ncbi:hypothetical protein TcWFU_008440 [Taenia crassiceps]|uniref:Uncharacterized protein n=1 Tax=Taenia crassiceps TaxID=6207 RepID=A0ABR4QN60_9CEST